MMIIVGIETLLIDSATIYAAGQSSASELADPNAAPAKRTRTLKPDEWVPWTAMSIGTIVVLYAFTLPQRFNRPGG